MLATFLAPTQTVEINFRNLGTGQDKAWDATGPAQADEMITALRASDTLQHTGASWTDPATGEVRRAAPAEIIIGFLADIEDASPWVPTSGSGGWMTTATLRELVESGRIVVENFAGYRFHAWFDGAAVHYTHSLYGIVSPDSVEITV